MIAGACVDALRQMAARLDLPIGSPRGDSLALCRACRFRLRPGVADARLHGGVVVNMQ